MKTRPLQKSLTIFILLLSNSAFGQFPLEDQNYVLEWYDDFNPVSLAPDASEKPNPNKWKYASMWEDKPKTTDKVNGLTNGNNLEVHWDAPNHGILTIYGRRENINATAIEKHFNSQDNTIKYVEKENYPFNYTTGRMSTPNKTFGYGYYETRIRLPQEYDYENYGNYYNVSWWLYGEDPANDIDWSELDFFEIVTESPQDQNKITFNMHYARPAHERILYSQWYCNYHNIDYEDRNNEEDPAHLLLARTDVSSIVFDGPNQINRGSSY